MNVVGLDLSLTGTGVASASGTQRLNCDRTGVERLAALRTDVMDATHVSDLGSGPLCLRCGAPDSGILNYVGVHPDLVAIEDYAFSRGNSHSHETGELGGVVKVALWEAAIPFALVGPTCLKKYATGKGTATKPDMRMALFQRAGIDERDDNKVDAWWLRAMALDHYGEPVVAMPAANREALVKVAWPVLAVAA